ncbi:hypothetical protein XENOCAPTIV_010938, partial [Xenoophorus captivus]
GISEAKTHCLNITILDCDGIAEGGVDDSGPTREFLHPSVVLIRDSRYFIRSDDGKKFGLPRVFGSPCVDDEEEEEETFYSPKAPSALERGRGRGRTQSSENRSFSSHSTSKQVIVDWTCQKAYHSSTGQIES